MPEIHVLPDHLASQIAAGEVVERPANVVKELVENALDAGARSVRVDLEGGGRDRIVVVDDGRGMDREDARLAFERHATSKIDSVDDLERVTTFGFRGEALASIASVARVELRTAREPGDGVRLRLEASAVRELEPCSHPRGTRLEVGSLFFNVPARRKFLKTPATELRRTVEVMQGYSLARPEVRFSLWHEAKLILEALPAEADADGTLERVGQLFRGLERRLTPLPERRVGDGGRIWGFIGDPSTTRGRRYFTFVNRRLVKDRALMGVFYRMVRDVWHSDEFPALFLFLDLPAGDVDVNVHPQKTEVRFRDGSLLGRVGASIGEALEASLGERPAPARETTAERGAAPLAWKGLGDGTTVAEAGRLAEAVYAPREPLQVPLSGRGGGRSSLRLLGQYKGTILLLEGPQALYLIDQHVAHERILYEKLRDRMARSEVPRQHLLAPALLELSRPERMRLAELVEPLDRCGLSLRELSDDDLALASVPQGMSVDEAERALLRLAREGAAEDDPDALRARLLDAWAADEACKAAVKMHEPLSPDAMRGLVSDLFECEQPFACPHGRPIVLEMTDADLERRFGRR